MNNLEIASIRESNDEKFIEEYYEGEAYYESENSSAINMPGAWSFFYLGDCIDNSDQEAKEVGSLTT